MPSPKGRGAERPHSLRAVAGDLGVSYAIVEKMVADGHLPAGALSSQDAVVAYALSRLPRRHKPRPADSDVAAALRSARLSATTTLFVSGTRMELLGSVLAATEILPGTEDAVVLLPVGAWFSRFSEQEGVQSLAG